MTPRATSETIGRGDLFVVEFRRSRAKRISRDRVGVNHVKIKRGGRI